jgi:L-rhamnose isomerase
LVSYEVLQEWKCIDSTTGEDLAEEVRSYFIPDFSNWKSHDDFERAFARLLTDLKASA